MNIKTGKASRSDKIHYAKLKNSKIDSQHGGGSNIDEVLHVIEEYKHKDDESSGQELALSSNAAANISLNQQPELKEDLICSGFQSRHSQEKDEINIFVDAASASAVSDFENVPHSGSLRPQKMAQHSNLRLNSLSISSVSRKYLQESEEAIIQSPSRETYYL